MPIPELAELSLSSEVFSENGNKVGLIKKLDEKIIIKIKKKGFQI